MKDQFALLLYGCVVAMLAWASWHWWSEHISFAMLVIVLLGYVVDNFKLRKVVRSLLAEREQHSRER